MGKNEIAAKIKNARLAAGMTQAEAARRLGCTYQAISNYERGTSRVEVDILVKLCDIYGISINDVLDVEEKSSINSPLINNDPELTSYLEELRTRPEMRMLFSVAKDATKEDVEKAVAIIEALRKTEGK